MHTYCKVVQPEKEPTKKIKTDGNRRGWTLRSSKHREKKKASWHEKVSLSLSKFCGKEGKMGKEGPRKNKKKVRSTGQ